MMKLTTGEIDKQQAGHLSGIYETSSLQIKLYYMTWIINENGLLGKVKKYVSSQILFMVKSSLPCEFAVNIGSQTHCEETCGS